MTELEEAYQQEKLDHERETRFNRDIQINEMDLMDKVSRLKTVMVNNLLSTVILYNNVD